MSKTRNPVARHSRTYNKAHVMTDRKKAAKRGYRKHKGHARQQDEVTRANESEPRRSLGTLLSRLQIC